MLTRESIRGFRFKAGRGMPSETVCPAAGAAEGRFTFDSRPPFFKRSYASSAAGTPGVSATQRLKDASSQSFSSFGIAVLCAPEFRNPRMSASLP